MRNFILKNALVIVVFITTTINAQDFQGMAVYQTKSKISIDLASSGIPADRIKMIEERMKNQLEKTFILTFNKYKILYKF